MIALEQALVDVTNKVGVDINRAVTRDEISRVRKAAEEAGLWRFCDPPGHDGFSI